MGSGSASPALPALGSEPRRGDDEAFSLQRVGEHDANPQAYSAGFRLTCCCV
jgi:hypothetical protein